MQQNGVADLSVHLLGQLQWSPYPYLCDLRQLISYYAHWLPKCR